MTTMSNSCMRKLRKCHSGDIVQHCSTILPIGKPSSAKCVKQIYQNKQLIRGRHTMSTTSRTKRRAPVGRSPNLLVLGWKGRRKCSLGSTINASNTTGSRGIWPKIMKETDDFWYPAQTKPPPYNFSPGNRRHL